MLASLIFFFLVFKDSPHRKIVFLLGLDANLLQKLRGVVNFLLEGALFPQLGLVVAPHCLFWVFCDLVYPLKAAV